MNKYGHYINDAKVNGKIFLYWRLAWMNCYWFHHKRRLANIWLN